MHMINSSKVISVKSSNERREKSASISGTVSDIWIKLGVALKHKTTILPNSLNLKIEDGGDRQLKLQKMLISPDWMKTHDQIWCKDATWARGDNHMTDYNTYLTQWVRQRCIQVCLRPRVTLTFDLLTPKVDHFTSLPRGTTCSVVFKISCSHF